MRLVQIWNEVCGYPAPSTTPWQFVMTVILYIWSTSSSVCDNQQTYTSSQDIKKRTRALCLPSSCTDASNRVGKCQRGQSCLMLPKTAGLKEPSTVETGPKELLLQALLSPEHTRQPRSRARILARDGEERGGERVREAAARYTHSSGCRLLAPWRKEEDAAFWTGRATGRAP